MATNPNLIVGIGASAGGLEAVSEIVEHLPGQFQGSILVAIHRTPNVKSMLGSVLQTHARMRVSDSIDGEHLSCTHIYVAQPSEILEVDGDEVHVDVDADSIRRMQRIDDLFSSIAESAGANSVGVVLSGMLWDGVAGLQAIKAAGGECIVQDPKDAQFPGMPQNALEAVECDLIGTPLEIASRLVELAAGRQCQ